MVTKKAGPVSKETTTRRDRVLDAAINLFAEHGVHGTSLQMIADRLGVAKGAVYYQFQSKDEIALAVVQPIYDDITHLTRIAELLPSPTARRDTALSGLVELSIRHRRISSLISLDPTILRLVGLHDEFSTVFGRFNELLLGPDPDLATRVATSAATGGIYYTATNPDLADVSDDELRPLLLASIRRCIEQHV